MKPIKLHYSEALVRRAVKAFWFRVTGWRFFIAMAVLVVFLIYFVTTGDRSWLVGVSGSVFTLGLVFAIALYFVHRRASLARFHRIRSPEATFEPGEQSFRITSDVGTTDLAWGTITEVWRFTEFWLVFFSRAQFITLPVADLDSEAREFILSRFKSNGIKVV